MKSNLSCVLLLIVLGVYASVILYFNRALFFSPFDIPYWQERFEQSQWRLPFTDRIIGDEGLYAYEGYAYINGADPTLSNAEAPPLGKYLIGLSILLSGNPYWAGLLMTITSIIIFYCIAKKIIPSRIVPLIGTILFALDPLVFQQTTAVMLDGAQLLFLLFSLYMLSLVGQTENKKWSNLFVFVSGISFGAFSAVKIPMITPFLLIGVIVYFRKMKFPVIPTTLLFLCGAVISYVSSYVRYFQLNHSVIEWLRIQKWMVAFYRGSDLSPNYGSVVTTLLFNRSQNFLTRMWESGDIWTFIWPCITLLFFFLFVRVMKKPKEHTPFLSLIIHVAAIILIFNFLVPFSTRYLLILLPLLYLSALKVFESVRNNTILYLSIIGLCAGNIIASSFVLFPTPEGSVTQFLYDWEHGYFSDMYERLDQASKTTDRKTFHLTGQQYVYDGQIEKAVITTPASRGNRFSPGEQLPVHITYKTLFLGEFSENKILTMVKENDTWKFHWNYSDLLEGLTPDSYLKSTVEFAKRGSVIMGNKPVAYDFPSMLISITPREINAAKEPEMLTHLEHLFDKDIEAAAIHDRYIIARNPDLPVPIAVLRGDLTPDQLNYLLSFPGVSVTPAMGRIQIPKNASGIMKNTLFEECCSSLYSTSSYDGISGIEQQYNEELKGINGGTLQIIGKDGSVIRTIVERDTIDGKDVSLPKEQWK